MTATLQDLLRPLADLAADGRGDLVGQRLHGTGRTASWGVPHAGDRRGAVLILLGGRDLTGASVALTERGRELRRQPGQVSLPGGVTEAHDASPAATALRETVEEIGIDVARVEVLGQFAPVRLAPARFTLTPVLARSDELLPLHRASPIEVERAAWVRLLDLADPRHRGSVELRNGLAGPAFDVDGLFVWGFTAVLLDAVLDVLGLERSWDRTRRWEVPARMRGPRGELR
jgi:8-oxo-dGTP pyrophosphatase MutT (NUDIX family)